MTDTQPKVAPMGRYDTKTTCSLLGICRATLRKYSKQGLIRPHYRKVNMRPFYYGSDIVRLWTVSV